MGAARSPSGSFDGSDDEARSLPEDGEEALDDGAEQRRRQWLEAQAEQRRADEAAKVKAEREKRAVMTPEELEEYE